MPQICLRAGRCFIAITGVRFCYDIRFCNTVTAAVSVLTYQKYCGYDNMQLNGWTRTRRAKVTSSTYCFLTTLTQTCERSTNHLNFSVVVCKNLHKLLCLLRPSKQVKTEMDYLCYDENVPTKTKKTGKIVSGTHCVFVNLSCLCACRWTKAQRASLSSWWRCLGLCSKGSQSWWILRAKTETWRRSCCRSLRTQTVELSYSKVWT